MPNIKSAKKRVKITAVKTLRNKSFKSKLKTSVKSFLKSQDPAEKASKFSEAISLLDRSVSKGIMPKNNIARKKSALAKKYTNFLSNVPS
ncbi:MAG: 30S ribosomal protein S20 [Candidatus Improbicoccus devescovinae]|nr:MAG: 30S ribosomal protein S20 [Candidatus Improbicoccus devescovinae]